MARPSRATPPAGRLEPVPASTPAPASSPACDAPQRGAIQRLADLTHALRRALRRKGRSREEAEDLVQDALLRYEAFRQAQPVDDPEAFIRRTALNLTIDDARRRRRSPIAAASPASYDAADPAPDPFDILAGRCGLERLKDGLAAMKPRTRTILLEQRLDGLTYAEIARRHGISPSAVEKHIARALLFLQGWMQEW